MTLRPTALISAQPPLLHAGLERIAREAGLDVTATMPADLVLRSSQPPSAAAIDVAVQQGVVVVTCRAAPRQQVWDAVLRIIDSAAG